MNAVKVINKQKNSGYIMADVGFVMLLANAFSYIFDWNIKSPAFTVLGLIFVLIV